MLIDGFKLKELLKKNYKMGVLTHFDKKIKRMLLNIKLGIILGAFFTILGVLLKFYQPSNCAINLYTKMHVVSDGSIFLVGGLLLFIGSIYSYTKREKIIAQ
jgi:hypothetical protein